MSSLGRSRLTRRHLATFNLIKVGINNTDKKQKIGLKRMREKWNWARGMDSGHMAFIHPFAEVILAQRIPMGSRDSEKRLEHMMER